MGGGYLRQKPTCTDTKACHSDGTAGHLGRTKTFYKVSQRYYWPGIFNDVEQFVSFISATQSQLYFMHVRNL